MEAIAATSRMHLSNRVAYENILCQNRQSWSGVQEEGQLLTTKCEKAILYSALMKDFLFSTFGHSGDFSSSSTTSSSVSVKSGTCAEVDQLFGEAGETGRSISWDIPPLSRSVNSVPISKLSSWDLESKADAEASEMIVKSDPSLGVNSSAVSFAMPSVPDSSGMLAKIGDILSSSLRIISFLLRLTRECHQFPFPNWYWHVLMSENHGRDLVCTLIRAFPMAWLC